VAALKYTCVLLDERKEELDERKSQFELMIHSLESENVGAGDELAESEKEDEDEDEAGNDNEDKEGTSGSSSKDAK
jgi:hypothetical protein